MTVRSLLTTITKVITRCKMNLFILHLDPKLCASFHMDKHVIKIILEAIQMLWCAKVVLEPLSDYSGAPKQYKVTHRNHPVAIWVRTSRANWGWTCQLVDALIDEWHYRYEHEKVHGCYETFRWLKEHPPSDELFAAVGLTPFAQAMPDEYKNASNAVEAYRRYYMSPLKAHLRQWRKRGRPSWFVSD